MDLAGRTFRAKAGFALRMFGAAQRAIERVVIANDMLVGRLRRGVWRWCELLIQVLIVYKVSDGCGRRRSYARCVL